MEGTQSCKLTPQSTAEDIQNTMMASLLYLCTHSHVVSGLGGQSGGQPVVQEFKVVLGGLHYENPEEQIIQDPVVPLPSPLKKPIQVPQYTVHMFSPRASTSSEKAASSLLFPSRQS